MKTPEEMAADRALHEDLNDAPEAEIKLVELSFPDDFDPAYLLNHPLEAIVVDEASGEVQRRRVGQGWRITL